MILAYNMIKFSIFQYIYRYYFLQKMFRRKRQKKNPFGNLKKNLNKHLRIRPLCKTQTGMAADFSIPQLLINFVIFREKPEKSHKEELKEKHRGEKRDDLDKEREREKRRERKEEKLNNSKEERHDRQYNRVIIFLLCIYRNDLDSKLLF